MKQNILRQSLNESERKERQCILPLRILLLLIISLCIYLLKIRNEKYERLIYSRRFSLFFF